MPNFDRSILGEPDCLGCLHLKLKATCIVVFFKDEEDNWRIGNFQTDKPRAIAETEVYTILNSNVADSITATVNGLVLNTQTDINTIFSNVGRIFEDSSVIGASVIAKNGISGVRLAWRDASEPFRESDLEIIRCESNCPEECD